jgi:hypothetical protein
LLFGRTSCQSLHAALDAYLRWIQARCVTAERRPTAWCGTQEWQIELLRAHLEDIPLSHLDTERAEELLEVIRLRPQGKRGKPVSISWTQSRIKRLRHFLKWLNKVPDFEWKRPADLITS